MLARCAPGPGGVRESQPGADVTTDDRIDAFAFVRDKAESAYHPSCTRRMGTPGDPAAVVDPETRVIGLDASTGCAWWTPRSRPR